MQESSREDKNQSSPEDNSLQKDKALSISPQTKPKKPPKPEDKPFNEFINDELIPALKKSLIEKSVTISQIQLIEGERPVVGGPCWMLYGEIASGRRFWLSFSEEKITSTKNIALAERGSNPSLLESFLIDERKTTLALLISRLLQRLNGQKWLDAN